jgi:malate dehydrogenase
VTVQTNASIVRDLASAVARVAPTAHVLVISNPVNSTVPIVASTLEKAGVFDPARLFGVTTLDVVRAARFLSGISNANPRDTPVTVIGGHSGATIVPLLSQSSYGKAITGEAYEKIVHRIQFGGDEVVKAKDGAGSATLSMAYAGAKFTNALLRGLNGEKGVITPTFVKSPLFVDVGIDFFSSNVELGVSDGYFERVCTDYWRRSTVLRKYTLLGPCLPKSRSCLTPACLSSRRTLTKAKLSWPRQTHLRVAWL